MSQGVTDLLGPEGAIARRLEQFEERPEQLELAKAVETCLAEKKHLLAEAGTGIGKSFAYLLPAVLHASRNRDAGPVVISTRTIALQQQLELKESGQSIIQSVSGTIATVAFESDPSSIDTERKIGAQLSQVFGPSIGGWPGRSVQSRQVGA